jgi:hypothetical protein
MPERGTKARDAKAAEAVVDAPPTRGDNVTARAQKFRGSLASPIQPAVARGQAPQDSPGALRPSSTTPRPSAVGAASQY